jgi:hypothetical protein
MDAELSAETATQATAHLHAMVAAIEAVARSDDPDQRREHWYEYEQHQAELHELLPLTGDPTADEGPYTSET